jgi:hypothetical protein
MSSSPVTPAMPLEGAKTLQQRLNILLTKLSRSIEIVKTWPSTDGDDASIHVKTTSKLISSILEIKSALENVEGTLKADAELRKALQSCPIPINLLDLLDHGNGLNPGTLSHHQFHLVCTFDSADFIANRLLFAGVDKRVDGSTRGLEAKKVGA